MLLVYIALGWVCGLFIAAAFDALIPIYWLILLGFSIFLTSILKGRKRWIGLALIAFALAGNRFAFVPTTSDVARFNTVGNATLEGIVLAEPDVRDDRIQLRLESQTIFTDLGQFNTSGTVLVNASRTVDVAYGDRIRATGTLATPAVFDTFSYADYLAQQGVFTVMQNATVEVTAHDLGLPFFATIFDLKQRAQTLIGTYLPDPQAALLTGILLGNERGIEPALADDFSRVGASHIIAISGFNMVIISELVTKLFMRVFKRRWLATALGILVIALYTLFVGANPAVVRAAVMSSLLAIAQALKRRTFIPASLSLVVILMTLHNPLVLWSISFQLSFFAVLGLALFTDPLTRAFDRFLAAFFPRGLARTVSDVLNEPLIVSIASLALTLPLTIIYFQRASLVVLLVNILIVPVQAALLVIGGIAVFVGFVAPPLAQILFWIDLVLLSWSIGIVRSFAQLPFADVAFTVDERVVGGLYVIVVGGAILNANRPPWALRFARWVRQQQVRNVSALAAISIVLLALAVYRSRPTGELHLWWLDVGHSNAVLMQTPGGAHMLFDGGQFPSRLLTSLGDRLPFYDRTLELVVISQPDFFDVAALPAVLGRYDAGVVLVNGQEIQTDVAIQLAEAITPYDVITASAGYTVTFSDGVQVEVLHPTELPEIDSPLGDGSLVLRIHYGDVSFLLPGDLTLAGQTSLLANGQWPLATVLQLPQHATARSLSDSFLEAVQPQLAILQSDVANRRGDPALDTLSQLGEIPLLRTDEEGAIHIWTDGSALWWVGES